jgi:hypothetical protein
MLKGMGGSAANAWVEKALPASEKVDTRERLGQRGNVALSLAAAVLGGRLRR